MSVVRLRNGDGHARLVNPASALDGRVDVFALLATSERIPKAELPMPGDNYAIIDLQYVGARLVQTGATSYGLQVAINTFNTPAHPAYPAEFDVYIDSTGDGAPDYVLYTAENGGFGARSHNCLPSLNLAKYTRILCSMGNG